MLGTQNPSRNHNPNPEDNDLDRKLSELAKQQEQDTSGDLHTKKNGEENQDETNCLSMDGNEQSDLIENLEIDLLPQNTEIVNMKDEDYEKRQNEIDEDAKRDEEMAEKGETIPVERQVTQDDYFKIKNIDTGESFDMREGGVEDKVTQPQVTLKGTPWKDFGKQIRKSNERLWDAAESGEVEKVKRILDKKKQLYPAEVNAKSLDDYTALHMSVNSGWIEVVEVLLEHNANIEAKTSMQRTPLHLSCMRGNLPIVKILVKHKANLNATDNDFNTPLHYVCEHGFPDILKFLLDQKPEITIKNHAGLTCVDVANNVEIRKIFEDRDLVNEQTVNSFGRTSIDDFVLYNSRADRIGKMLHMGNMNQKMMMMQKQNPKKDAKSNISQVVIQNFANGNSPSKEKVTPSSFTCHYMLGKGSFGEVYLVEKQGSKKLFAMKVLRKDRILNQNLTRYAKTERNVLSIMDHPFIVKLNYAFQTENKLYLILDYAPGGDLGSVISKKKRLSEDIARIYAAEITLALEALHKKDIIFRDLKPDNVVLDQDGHALLTDFGLSKEGVKEGLTSRSFCGSVAYLAPEMLRRSGHNRTVDWYLLGVLIYEMLVGIPPYFSSNRDELFQNIQKAQLKLPKILSDEAKTLITSLLKRDPVKRLGANNDAAAIKDHPWFKPIDWEEALQRKLKPPVIEKKIPKLNHVINAKFEDPNTADEKKNQIPNWTFISPEEM